MLILSIGLAVSVLCILILIFTLLAHRQRLIQSRQQLAKLNEELSKVIGKDREQTIQILELKNQLDTNLSKDALTGLISRQIFDDRLGQILKESKRHHLIFGILFLNFDGFKIINDALGLDAGDKLLKEAGKRFQNSLRQLDTVSRFSGDEFLFILPQLGKPESAAYVAQRLLESLAQPFQLGDREIFITASIGISIFPNDGDDAKQLLKNADNALHQAKTKGHNSYQFYHKEMYVVSQRELALSSSLHSQAIYDDFLIYYQPQVHITEKKVIGMEAILRWKHPDFGLIDLHDFLRLAENSGNINQIGDWILRNACQQFQIWKKQGFFLQTLSIGISRHQLENPHFIYQVSQLLKEFDMDPSSLILEIAELMLQTKSGITHKSLLMLSELGVQICINEFGAGNIALWELKGIPIDSLKIANSLIKDVTINKDAASIVKIIIALAKALELNVSAGNVETQKQMQLLKSMGCHVLQGDVFSAPVLPHEFTLLAEKSIVENV